MTEAGIYCAENLVDPFYSKLFQGEIILEPSKASNRKISYFINFFIQLGFALKNPGRIPSLFSKLNRPNSLNFFLHTSFFGILLMTVYWSSKKSNNTVRRDKGVARNESFQSIRPAKSFLKTT